MIYFVILSGKRAALDVESVVIRNIEAKDKVVLVFLPDYSQDRIDFWGLRE